MTHMPFCGTRSRRPSSTCSWRASASQSPSSCKRCCANAQPPKRDFAACDPFYPPAADPPSFSFLSCCCPCVCNAGMWTTRACTRRQHRQHTWSRASAPSPWRGSEVGQLGQRGNANATERQRDNDRDRDRDRDRQRQRQSVCVASGHTETEPRVHTHSLTHTHTHTHSLTHSLTHALTHVVSTASSGIGAAGQDDECCG